jgi:hypothetical protein
MQERLIYVAQRAYELARSGEYSDLASVEKAIVEEGFLDGVAWLQRPDVKDSLQVICRHSQERRPSRGVDNQRCANGVHAKSLVTRRAVYGDTWRSRSTAAINFLSFLTSGGT